MGLLARTLIISLVPLACGCTTYMVKLPASTTFDERSPDAIIVLRVVPMAKISIEAGAADRQGWRSVGGYASYASWSEEGFLVLKVKPRTGKQNYAIVEITPDSDLLNTYERRKEEPVLVFHAVAGQVTYVGALKFQVFREVDGEDKLVLDQQSDPDDFKIVSEHMARTYPRIRNKIVSEPYRQAERVGSGLPR